MIRKSELAATPNLEQIVAAARGIPATVLSAPEQHPAARLSAAVRFQYLARVVRFWHQAERSIHERQRPDEVAGADTDAH